MSLISGMRVADFFISALLLSLIELSWSHKLKSSLIEEEAVEVRCNILMSDTNTMDLSELGNGQFYQLILQEGEVCNATAKFEMGAKCSKASMTCGSEMVESKECSSLRSYIKFTDFNKRIGKTFCNKPDGDASRRLNYPELIWGWKLDVYGNPGVSCNIKCLSRDEGDVEHSTTLTEDDGEEKMGQKTKRRSPDKTFNFDENECKYHSQLSDLLKPSSKSPSEVETCYCGQSSRRNRIVGGRIAEVNEYPWQVGFVKKKGRTVFCGGTLVDKNYVLTAAHCAEQFKPITDFQVLLGEHDTARQDETTTLRYNLQKVIIHPKWKLRIVNYDFALVKLKGNVNFGTHSHIRPACIPKSELKDGSEVTVTGWGKTSDYGSLSNLLNKVQITVVNHEDCVNTYGDTPITEAMICASGDDKDACQGDSGGPMIRQVQNCNVHEIVGVTSWGMNCADPKYPGIYANVYLIRRWLIENIEPLQCRRPACRP